MNLPRIPVPIAQEPLTSGDLIRLGQLLSGRVRMTCYGCRSSLKLSVGDRGLRLGSSPILTGVDDTQTGRPRLVFYCHLCRKIVGFVEADLWQWDDGALKQPGDTRWDHLEFDEPGLEVSE